MSSHNRSAALLDSRLLHTFITAANTKTFTAAATEANMTQSGVSQQIAKLEEQVGVSLFKRIGKKVVLTKEGHSLKRYAVEQISMTQQLLDNIRSSETHISGLVSYGMPPSCLLSPHFTMLLERRKAHSDVELNITLDSSAVVEKLLLADRLDFCFVTDSSNHPLLEYMFFCTESFALVAAHKENFRELRLETLHHHRFILYPGAEYYYDRWLANAFPETPNIKSNALYYAGEINSINGAIDMAIGGLGILVIPLHCVIEPLKKKALFQQPRKKALPNSIFIATIKEHSYPLRVRSVIDWFMSIYRIDSDR